jgi:hypothetical protein
VCKNEFCFVSLFVICLPLALVTIVAGIWGTLLEKSHHLAVENPMEQSLS